MVPCRKLRSGPERVGLGPWNFECRLGWSRLCLCESVKDIDTGGGPGLPGYPKALLQPSERKAGVGEVEDEPKVMVGKTEVRVGCAQWLVLGGGLAGLRHPDTWSTRILGVSVRVFLDEIHIQIRGL